jgi:predicted transcriptional regulator
MDEEKLARNYEEWFTQKVEEGLREMQAGNLFDQGEIVKKWEASKVPETLADLALSDIGSKT